MSTQSKLNFHTRFNPPKDPGIDTGSESKVRQSEKDNCDVNIIMERFTRSGQLPRMNHREGVFMNCSGADYQRSLEIIRQANDDFAQLPSKARKYFDHDPEKFIEFMHQPNNAEKAVELGLADWIKPSAEDSLREAASTIKESFKKEKTDSTKKD